MEWGLAGGIFFGADCGSAFLFFFLLLPRHSLPYRQELFIPERPDHLRVPREISSAVFFASGACRGFFL